MTPRLDIHFLSRQDIDLKRWDRAVSASSSGLPYAYSWYLDIVSRGKWHGLVQGDYERIMPLVWNAKLFGTRQIYQPVLAQQLGIFGQQATPWDYPAFFHCIPRTYRYVQMNVQEDLSGQEGLVGRVNSRTNLVLALNRPYDEIRSHYSKSLRKRLRKAALNHTFRVSSDVVELIGIYKENLEQKVGLGNDNYAIIANLTQEVLRKDLGEIYKVLDKKGSLCAVALFLRTEKRTINIFGASTRRGRELHSMHFLLDQVIRLDSGSPRLFDFEGSELTGVADFFRSFGSVSEYYSEYKKDRLPWLLKLIKNRGELFGRNGQGAWFLPNCRHSARLACPAHVSRALARS